MDRLREALRIAEELLLDIELQRLKASEIVLKASGLARLIGREDLSSFLTFERDGYRSDGSDMNWIQRAGRNSDDGKFFNAPLSKIEATLRAAEAALKTLRGGGNYSGEYASVAAREHDQKIAAYVKLVATNGGICKQVVSTTYSMVVEANHELLFSDLQATLFTSAQEQIDGRLAEAGGSALDKIERVSDRLRDGDPESVSQGLTTCRRLIDTCADHLFAARAEPYSLGEGVEMKVGRQQVLNRLQAYTHEQGISKSRQDRIRVTVRENLRPMFRWDARRGLHPRGQVHLPSNVRGSWRDVDAR